MASPAIYASQIGKAKRQAVGTGSHAIVVKLEKRRLEMLRGSAKGNLTKMVKKMANDVLSYAQMFVPVDTGTLKASLKIYDDVTGLFHQVGGTFLIAIAVGSPLDYAIYPEYGTSRQAAQPYLGPAFELGTKNIEVMVEEYLVRKGLRGG